jgi:four helix bundle protein
MAPYERLDAWQLCHQLALAVYRATDQFPKSELYGLTSQSRRAAFSAAANIVEGSTRRGKREFRRFLDISLGSLAELEYILRLCRELGMLDDARAAELTELQSAASKVTWGLYRKMARV